MQKQVKWDQKCTPESRVNSKQEGQPLLHLVAVALAFMEFML